MNEQTGPEQEIPDSGTPGRGAEDVPQSEEEVRARLEEQVRKLRVQDLMVESVVSVLNLTARRIAKEDERDLEQARIGIDAIRAWVDLLPEEVAGQIRQALSELQMLYAQAVEGGGGEPPQTPDGPEGSAPKQPPQQPSGGEPPPKLWTPHSRT